MKLTPIPKRKRAAKNRDLGKQQDTANNAIRLAADGSGTHPSPPSSYVELEPKRVLTAARRGLRAAPDEAPRRLQVRARRRKTSLRDMPDWFLADVFMTEKNFSFPRCSGWIGRALSHPYVLRRLIAAAFAPTWDNWFGCAAEDVRSYMGLGGGAASPTWLDDRDRFGGNPKLQDDVLAQPWLTLARLLQAQQVWLATQRKGVPSYYRVPSPFARGESIGTEGFVRDPDFSVQAQFGQEFDALAAALAADSCPPRRYPVMLEVHSSTSFPERLITGPWGHDDVKLLFWLGRAGARMSENQSWEIVIEGLDRMAAVAEAHRPGTPGHDLARTLVNRLVGIFQMFKIWDKIPDVILQSHPNDLGWLSGVLKAKTTRVGKLLSL